MAKEILAIALCRVSSLEQLKNNSLKHQKENVFKAAEALNARIPKDGVWAGQVSSKKGFNYNRKDLMQMFEYTKQNKDVKYLIVQEVDRFMRSPDEQTYWIVKFWYERKVRVWFADKPELNEDTHEASLLRYLDGWRAGGSNVERINKSINGQTAALLEGKYPFNPKPGYKKGRLQAIPEVDPTKGLALQKVLKCVAANRVTPTQGLKDLNKSAFMSDGHSLYKMDKFRKIATDPFYAGILEIDKQVKVRNERGLHEALISKEEHYALVEIFNNKHKNQSGPRKNGNPLFPMSNKVNCDACSDATNGRYVGLELHNGKNTGRIYRKYRCRSCKHYLSQDDVHDQIMSLFNKPLDNDAHAELSDALSTVWKSEDREAESEINRLEQMTSQIQRAIRNQALAAIDPDNAFIRDEIQAEIARNKEELKNIENQINDLKRTAECDKSEFFKFAADFINKMGSNFLDTEMVSKENRERCKQIVFPAGFHVDSKDKVYTPEISELYTLLTTEKDTFVPSDSHLVRVRRL